MTCCWSLAPFPSATIGVVPTRLVTSRVGCMSPPVASLCNCAPMATGCKWANCFTVLWTISYLNKSQFQDWQALQSENQNQTSLFVKQNGIFFFSWKKPGYINKTNSNHSFNKLDLTAYLPVLMRPISGDLLPLIFWLHLSFRQISYWSKVERKYFKYSKQSVIKARVQSAFQPYRRDLRSHDRLCFFMDLTQQGLCQKLML